MRFHRAIVSMSCGVTVGIPSAFVMKVPSENVMRPDRILSNVPCFGFASINHLQIGTTDCLIGDSTDMFFFTPARPGLVERVWMKVSNFFRRIVGICPKFFPEPSSLSLPLMKPTCAAKVIGKYTGMVPKGYKKGMPYLIIVTIAGDVIDGVPDYNSSYPYTMNPN